MPISTIGTASISGLGYGFKNRIINGAMGIWQRGTTSSGNVYLADRWAAYNGTITTYAQSTDVPSGFKYSASITGSGYAGVNQKIESLNCTDLSGQAVTVSFWAKQTSGAGSNSLTVFLGYPTSGTADTWGSGITSFGTAVNINGAASWTYYTMTFPALTANALLGVSLQIYANTASAVTYLITGVQLEKGTVATDFDYRPYGTELALCQRYLPAYIYSSASGTEFVGWVRGLSTASTASAAIPFTVTARVPPTGATVSGSYAVSGLSFSTVAFNYASLNVGVLSLSGGSGMTVNNLYDFQCSTAGSKVLFTGCEL